MAIDEIRRLMAVGMPAEMAKEVDAAVGAGGLQIGTTGTTAMAGNKVPTATERGGALLAPVFADIAGAPTEQNFNDLLGRLRTAGILATS